MSKASSITDQAISTIEEESLDTDSYVHALSAFIDTSATPLTIGIQGEWGSGKTSMMNLIRVDMEKADHATAWVNTWEFSMFREPPEIAPAILKGLLESLRQKCEEEGNWPASLSKNVEKVSKFLKQAGMFALNAGVKQVTGSGGFTDNLQTDGSTHQRAEIAEIKREISEIVEHLTKDKKNPYKRVIFFVDDLDRIDPAIAVNVLEAMKNMFDIPLGIFVLAIDYEVVVKGLEQKFGKKTPENEREFRSFFDKIIQVPFSMPISNYNIEKLLTSRLSAIGMEIPKGYEESYSSIVSNTVGGNPRSIKRYINTFSLLRNMANLAPSEDQRGDPDEKEFLLFAIVGLQISFPRIYQLIIKDSDYISWENSFLDDLSLENKVQERMKSDDMYDEIWEQIIWSFAQTDSYLRARANNILTALNIIRKKVGDENLGTLMEETLQITNITSVDDDQESQQRKRQHIRLADWDEFYKVKLSHGYKQDNLELTKTIMDLVTGQCDSKGHAYKIKYTPGEFGIYLDLGWERGAKIFGCIPNKKRGIRVWFPDVELVMKISTAEDAGTEFREALDTCISKVLARAAEKAA